MDKIQGFFLMEVLISLILITSIAFNILQQHYQTTQLLNQISKKMATEDYFENALEKQRVYTRSKN